jgi:2-polyprenyl-3-methyl-5-hydroxy-6-metoxy-1,4-benzoquinol methylase
VANPDNLLGHRARYESLKKKMPADKLGFAYVGSVAGSDSAAEIGFREEEILRHYHELDGAYVIDLGCGIGRLTRYLADSPVARYLGTDILPEILAEAQKSAASRDTFSFAIAENFQIPEDDNKADIVCAFSLMTHLLDTEVRIYFRETARVLKPGGVAIFSFLDFALPQHFAKFEAHIAHSKPDHDILKFFEKDTLQRFATKSGLDVIGFVDAQTPLSCTGARPMMWNGSSAPKSVKFGQSLICMRKPMD